VVFGLNNVILIGRLTKDPELRYTITGIPVATFRLAVDKGLSREKKQEMESKGQPTADFINIVVYGKQAENCANYLGKGRLTAIQGRIQSRSYDAKDGSKRYVTEVIANRVEFIDWGGNTSSSNFGSSYDDEGMDYPDIDGFAPVDDDNIPF